MKYLLSFIISISAQSFASCDDLKEGSTRRSDCISGELIKGAETKMQYQYEFLLKAIEKFGPHKDDLTRFKESQDNWIIYRAQQCDLEQSIFGGSNSVNWGYCSSRLTNIRQQEIERIYMVYEGRDIN